MKSQLFLHVTRGSMSEAMQMSLRHRVFRAGWWTLTSYLLNLAIRFGSNILIARLLAPEMFGVMTIAITVSIGLAMFSDLGLKQNIIQSARGHEAKFLNTAWTIQVLRGILLWLVAICVGISIILANRFGLVSPTSVYAADGLPTVIIVSSLSAIIAGFESTKLFEASRGLLLSRVTAIEILAQVTGVICMVGWVIFDRSIWVLVSGGLASSFARMALSHVIVPGVSNRLQWDKKAAHELVHYGKWIFLSSVLGFLVSSGDRMLLAGLVSSTVLGLYSIAALIPVSVDGILNKVMSEVSFPAFSEVARERRQDLKKTYYHFFGILAPTSYLLSGFLVTSAQSIVQILYDTRYHQAGWMLSLLSIVLLTIPSRLGVQCYLALGLPKLTSYIILARLGALYTTTPLGYYLFGLEGAISGIVFSQFISLPIIYFYNLRYQLFDLRQEFQMLVFLLVGLSIGKLFEWVTQLLMASV
jgi:O-antigen/teichoic acid export membrane protein